MNALKHTPGPWRFEQPDEQSPNIWIVAEENAGIAKIEPCDYDDGMGHRHTGEDWANTLLISLAPEMFELLRTARAMKEPTREWLDAACAIISKVEAE